MNQIVRLPSQLGALIQSERLRRNMTQQQLASLIGKQQKTISAIENGSEGTKLDTLLRVIAILDLDLQVIPRRKDGKDIADVAKTQGISSTVANNAIWAIGVGGGFLVNLFYCFYLLKKNGTFRCFFNQSSGMLYRPVI